MNAPHRRKEWLEFKDWCKERKLKAFPAHPWTVSVYALWLEANRRYRTLHKRMDVIARVHIRACAHSPDTDALVQRTLSLIENRHTAPKKSSSAFDGSDLLAPKKRKLSLVEEPPKRILRHIPPLVSKRPQMDA